MKTKIIFEEGDEVFFLSNIEDYNLNGDEISIYEVLKGTIIEKEDSYDSSFNKVCYSTIKEVPHEGLGGFHFKIEDDLMFASLKDAEKECKKRNKETIKNIKDAYNRLLETAFL